jgi:hypothetical protein
MRARLEKLNLTGQGWEFLYLAFLSKFFTKSWTKVWKESLQTNRQTRKRHFFDDINKLFSLENCSPSYREYFFVKGSILVV